MISRTCSQAEKQCLVFIFAVDREDMSLEVSSLNYRDSSHRQEGQCSIGTTRPAAEQRELNDRNRGYFIAPALGLCFYYRRDTFGRSGLYWD